MTALVVQLERVAFCDIFYQKIDAGGRRSDGRHIRYKSKKYFEYLQIIWTFNRAFGHSTCAILGLESEGI